MPCFCKSPVRPSFKDSYNDLLDQPKVNGVTLRGNLTPADLGIKAGAQFKVVSQLPVTDIDETTVYLVPIQIGQADNIYQEWIYINNKWEKIGDSISLDIEKPTVFCKSIILRINSDDSYDVHTLVSVESFNLYSSRPISANSLYFSMFSSDGVDGIGIAISNTGSETLELNYHSFDVGLATLLVPNYSSTTFRGELITMRDTILIRGDWSDPISI